MRSLPSIATAAGALFLAAGLQAATPERVVLRDVQVVNVRTGAITPAQAVTIAGDRIERIEPDARAQVAPASRVIAGGGRYLIPGLADMHLHGFLDENDPRWVFPLLLAHGVTRVRDMGSLVPLVRIRAVREEIAAGKRIGPRLHIAGPVIDGLNTVWEAPLGVPTPAEAETAVAMLHEQGADFVKVYPMLSRASYFAVMDAARKRGLAVAGQVPESVTIEDAARAGQRSFEHMEKLVTACSELEPALTRWRDEMLQTEDGVDAMLEAGPQQVEDVLDTYDPARCERVIATLAATGSWVVPALVGEDAMRATRHDPNDARLAYLPLKLREAWIEIDLALRMEMEGPQIRRINRLVERMKSLVPRLEAAGVRLLAGTNAGMLTPFVFPGSGLHEELANLVNAGLTPLAALRAATLDAAIFAGEDKRAGEIAAGQAADLVLLERNPLADIRAVGEIRLVVARGRVFERGEIDRMLRELRALAGVPLREIRFPAAGRTP